MSDTQRTPDYTLRDDTIWHLDRHARQQKRDGHRWTYVDVDALIALVKIAISHRGLADHDK